MQERILSRADARKTGLATAIVVCVLVGWAVAQDAANPPSPNANATQRYIGTIKSIDATGFTLTSDLGQDSHIALTDSTRLVRIAPGEKNLKNAAPVKKEDLQAGDR